MAERAPHHLVPSAFRTIIEVPLSPAGKVDRRALPVPSLDRPELGTTFVAPRTRLERKLANTWADVLRLDRIGLHDNFFELGGNSLLLMRIYQELREMAEIPSLRITDLFKYPTVASLARGVARQQAGTAGGSSTRRRATALARRRERQS